MVPCADLKQLQTLRIKIDIHSKTIQLGTAILNPDQNNMQKGAMQTHRTFSSESIHVCLCLCDNTNIKYILESQKCNISCKTSIKNGECGGKGFFSVYESTNFMLPDKHYGGFFSDLSGTK